MCSCETASSASTFLIADPVKAGSLSFRKIVWSVLVAPVSSTSSTKRAMALREIAVPKNTSHVCKCSALLVLISEAMEWRDSSNHDSSKAEVSFTGASVTEKASCPNCSATTARLLNKVLVATCVWPHSLLVSWQILLMSNSRTFLRAVLKLADCKKALSSAHSHLAFGNLAIASLSSKLLSEPRTRPVATAVSFSEMAFMSCACEGRNPLRYWSLRPSVLAHSLVSDENTVGKPSHTEHSEPHKSKPRGYRWACLKQGCTAHRGAEHFWEMSPFRLKQVHLICE